MLIIVHKIWEFLTTKTCILFLKNRIIINNTAINPSFKYPASEGFSNNPLHIEILYYICRGALAWYTIFQNPFI